MATGISILISITARVANQFSILTPETIGLSDCKSICNTLAEIIMWRKYHDNFALCKESTKEYLPEWQTDQTQKQKRRYGYRL